MLVAVQLSVLGLYLPPVLKELPKPNSAPDYHFTAGPDCRVTSGIGRVGGAGGCPTIRAGIVSTACVEIDYCHQPPPQTIISLPVQTAV